MSIKTPPKKKPAPTQSKKVDVQKNQIDFISGAERAPKEWEQYDNSKRSMSNLRLTERENKMLFAAAEKLSKQLGVKITKQDYIVRTLKNSLTKELELDDSAFD